VQLTTIELQYVSPKLLVCKDLELAVPGTYDPHRPIVRIRSIQHTLQVITSKQRPRKLSIKGQTCPRDAPSDRIALTDCSQHQRV